MPTHSTALHRPMPHAAPACTRPCPDKPPVWWAGGGVRSLYIDEADEDMDRDPGLGCGRAASVMAAIGRAGTSGGMGDSGGGESGGEAGGRLGDWHSRSRAVWNPSRLSKAAVMMHWNCCTCDRVRIGADGADEAHGGGGGHCRWRKFRHSSGATVSCCALGAQGSVPDCTKCSWGQIRRQSEQPLTPATAPPPRQCMGLGRAVHRQAQGVP